MGQSINWLTEWETKETDVLTNAKVPYQFRYGYLYEEESVEGSFAFGNEQEDKEYLEKFKTGEYISLVAYVEVILDGHKGTDYLGQCHCTSLKREKEMLEMIEWHGMLDEALNKAKQSLIDSVDRAKKYL